MAYEYFNHFPREIELFWKKGVTGASVLFLANRYLSLLPQIAQTAITGSMSAKVRHSAPIILSLKSTDCCAEVRLCIEGDLPYACMTKAW